MLRMRLQRRGKKNYATYRVVVADQRAPIKGKFVEDVGSYNPHTDAFSVNAEKVTGWIGKGVQPSNTVHNLLVTHEIIKGEKVTSWKPKKKEVAEGEEGAGDDAAVEETTAEEKPAEAPEELTSDEAAGKAPSEKTDGPAKEDEKGDADAADAPSEGEEEKADS